MIKMITLVSGTAILCALVAALWTISPRCDGTQHGPRIGGVMLLWGCP
jgi:hypothetical protein